MADNNMTILLNSGFDAFSNLYRVEITPPIGVSSEVFVTDVRVKDFSAPTLSLTSYENHYNTISFPRLAPMIEGDRTFELTFRVDANYKLYYALKDWRAKLIDIYEDKVYFGAYANGAGNPNLYGSIRVKALRTNVEGLQDNGADSSIVWEMKHVVLYNITEPDYSRTSSSPVQVTCKFVFGEYTKVGA